MKLFDLPVRDGERQTLNPAIPVVLIVLAGASLFYPVTQFEFVDYDDQLYILGDPSIREFSAASLKSILFEPFHMIWYPVTRLSHAIEFWLFGESSAFVHTNNVLIHLLNGWLFYLVLSVLGKKLTGREILPMRMSICAVFLALLFVVHPQHVEPVAWAVQRKELLATGFALGSVYAWLKDNHTASIFFLALALMSKSSAVMLPVAFVLLDMVFMQQQETVWKRLLRSVWRNRYLLLLSFFSASLAFWNHDSEGAMFLSGFTATSRFSLYVHNALAGIEGFIGLQSRLFHQPVSHHVFQITGVTILQWSMFALLVTLSAWLLTRESNLGRLAGAGVAFYLVALVPVGGIMVFGNYAFGDRYLYLTSIGLYVSTFSALVALGIKVQDRRQFYPAVAGMVTVCALAMYLSSQALPKFRSTETLWLDDFRRNPDSVMANYHLGLIYFMGGQKVLGVDHFNRAIKSKADHFRVGPREASALFVAEYSCEKGRDDQAIAVLEQLPGFGGDLAKIEPLLESLAYLGYYQCFESISNWYELQLDLADP